ncbi:MAG: ADP-heptose:LPS heptosyltransferase, partial [Candidatus Omnitrophota bacterium]
RRLKTLVINPFGIGDVLFSFRLVEELKRNGDSIGYLCNERTDALIDLNLNVEHTYIFNRDDLRTTLKTHPIQFIKKIHRLINEIKSHQYDRCLDLSMGREYSFLMFLAGIKKRIGLNYKHRSKFLTQSIELKEFKNRHVSEYHLDLLFKDRVAPPCAPLLASQLAPKSKTKFDTYLKDMQLRPWVAVAPGGGVTWGDNANYKQWSPSNYAALIKSIHNNGQDVLLFGSPDERSLLEQVAKASDLDFKHILTDLNLDQTTYALSQALGFVGNDGGLFHLAHWTGIPSLGIFGPVDEVVYGAGWCAARHQHLSTKVECRPCYKAFRFTGCDYDRQCLEAIDPKRAFLALQNLSIC